MANLATDHRDLIGRDVFRDGEFVGIVKFADSAYICIDSSRNAPKYRTICGPLNWYAWKVFEREGYSVAPA